MEFMTNPVVLRLVESPELIDSTLCDFSDSKLEQGALLVCVALTLKNRFEQSGSSEDLNRAIATSEQALSLLPADDPSYPLFLCGFSSLFLARLHLTGSKDDLNQAIQYTEQALERISENDSNRLAVLNDHGNLLRTRFELGGPLEDLNAAIQIAESIVEVTMADDEPVRLAALTNLGIALTSRFRRTGCLSDLDRAIEIGQAAVDHIPDGHFLQLACVANFGGSLLERFGRTGRIDDLNRTISTLSFVAELPSFNDPSALLNLCKAYCYRFERLGSWTDLGQALAGLQLLRQWIPRGHLNELAVLSLLSNLYYFRFQRTYSMEDLDKSIEIAQDALQHTVDSPQTYAIIFNLCLGLVQRFDRFGVTADLGQAVTGIQATLQSIPRGHQNEPAALALQSMVLYCRYQQNNSVDDLDKAIDSAQAALDLAISFAPKTLLNPHILAIVYVARYEKLGYVGDLEKAIEVDRTALQLIPEEDQVNRHVVYNGLCYEFLIRYSLLGSTDDLEASISSGLTALNLVHANHVYRGEALNNLALALCYRGSRIASLDDLNHAVDAARESLSSITMSSPARPQRLNTLAIALETRMLRSLSIQDAEEAVSTRKEITSLMPQTAPPFARALCNYAFVLYFRFRTFGDRFLNDLDIAIELSEKALTLTPRNNRGYPRCLNALFENLKARFDCLKRASDLERAIRVSETALELLPIEHADRALFLIGASLCWWSKFLVDESADSREHAIMAIEDVIKTSNAPPNQRIDAAVLASRFLCDDPCRAFHILKPAVLLLPTVSPNTLRRRDQQYALSEYFGLASCAASTSIESNDTPYQTLQLLEIGRGVMASFHLDIRSNVSLLEEAYPDIARRFLDVREQLGLSSTKPISTMEASLESENHLNFLSKQFENIIESIRSLNGFERFLLGPSESELKGLAEYGPIVVFNVSVFRGDALVVTPEEIRCLPLPMLKLPDLERYAQQFVDAVQSKPIKSHLEAKHSLKIVLEWLWDAAVGPVLDLLQLTKTPRQNDVWPRVWWIGCGLLAILPIHAAGYHDLKDSKTAIDRVISSYTTTLKALNFARVLERNVFDLLSQNALLIGMPTTPDKTDLSFVDAELDALQNFFPASIQTTILRKPTKRDALSILANQQIVHLSCHGNVSTVEPSQSYLLLEDWKSSPLTVSDLIALKIRSPRFAFLSSCNSAAARQTQLSDESINLASAFQLAGFPSVIGTLWQVTDSHSPDLAKGVYKWMFDGESKLDIGRAAEGLHHSVRHLRDQTRRVPGFSRAVEDDPLIWASYVHFGI